MSDLKKVNKKSLRNACWERQMTVSELCRRLGISRQTAYCAWNNPTPFPVAAPKLFKELELSK